MTDALQLAEIQGLYGPVTLSERLIQRIWLRQDYQAGTLRTQSGKTLNVHHPGRWNLLEGPDFIGADYALDGQRHQGDVEIHFYEKDWTAHGHSQQASFNKVRLHVVVFPPKGEHPARTLNGTQPETVCLLPYLNEDLEAYAAQEAMHAWEGRDAASLLENFLCLGEDERLERLIANARKRFQQKVSFCQKRLEIASWEQALHSLTLEVLGYSRNRSPMHAIAQAYEPKAFARENVDTLLESQAGKWKLAGLRPANQPRHRLSQYQSLLCTRPDWQSRLLAWAKSQRHCEGCFRPDTKSFRKTRRLTAQRREMAESIMGHTLSGTRLDTWMVDAALPLLAVNKPTAWFPIWFHWFQGDMPDAVTTVLKHSGMPPAAQPRCNGIAQGAWQLFLESGL